MTAFETVTFEQSPEIGALAEALAKAQGTLESVAKDRAVNTGTYAFRYADLASVLAEVRPALAANGLAVIQSPSRANGAVEVVTLLAHASGQWVRGRISMPADAKPQSVGSAITYARRYALSAILGVASEDDEGQAAGKGGRAEPEVETNQPRMVQRFAEVGISAKQLERYLGHSLGHVSDQERDDLAPIWKSVSQGSVEAREIICGPSPAKAMQQELGL